MVIAVLRDTTTDALVSKHRCVTAVADITRSKMIN